MSKELTKDEMVKKFLDMKKKSYNYAVKRRIWQELMVVKAKAANITVSDTEVLEELKKRDTSYSE